MVTQSKSNTIGLLTFIGMTCALVASVRNIPDLAATGWNMFLFMGIATFAFALPITLISGEFAGMKPEAGGPELWVTDSLNERCGFITSWLLWVQMFPGMVMVGSALAPLLAIAIGDNSLSESNIFTLACILIVYWAISILNIFFDMAKIGGKVGAWFGVYIPVIILLILGIAATFKTGVQVNNYLGEFSASKLFPDSFSTTGTLQYLAAICFIFSGIEMSSVYITRLNNPIKTYIKGIFIALIFMLLFNLINAFFVANSVSFGKIELNNIAQAPVIWIHVLGLPSWLANVFAACVFIGVVVQLSAWASGPSKTIQASARRGLYPPSLGFWRENKYGVSRSIILTQAVIISIFALVYLLIPAVNSAFLLLVTSTSVIYCVVYVLMAIGILRMRYTAADAARPFRIGGSKNKSNFWIWFVVVVLLLTIAISVILTLVTFSAVDALIVIIITAVMVLIPLYVHHIRKPIWKTQVEAQLTALNQQHLLPTPKPGATLSKTQA
ncbi:amino acid permease [Wohlfahrtiimonas chitiniclastica]|uniref:Amino acid permease n=2 Tax=Wohlfahrtiimonas chitiniclastica TaxID=400946 RepID=A0AB35C1P2_9GAMM|nr:amino acid permease [Wohlfahrtiimonas chitiniclastica]MBS7822227.1 amino acid permease [Wohlfahrtiimonas chitiniclastica]MBS7824343.1 amino acid permease [Wohlfahrtiimonas chitiniclastica]MBS7830289.1 amino acid permease [Wohlfahrtiimonas chitiniclastica]MBS7832257.1 amino acid permease [Wohlfahrtiimonas chitiniclastica]